MPGPTDLSPRFGGLEVFGVNAAFVSAPMVGGPASIDLFLGNAPGTTLLANQQLFAVSGQFVESTSAAVAADIATLQGMAGMSFPFGFPTNLRFPVNYVFAAKPCYFLPQEFRASAVGPAPGNQFAATYKLVMRRT